jgi:hypothetical protein
MRTDEPVFFSVFTTRRQQRLLKNCAQRALPFKLE